MSTASATLESKIVIDTNQLLNQGGFCLVYPAVDPRNPEKKYVAKKEKRKTSDESDSDVLAQEHMFLSYLNHERIPKSLGFVQKDRENYLIVEFMPGKSMNLVQGRLKESAIIDFAFQISTILEYVHEAGIIHADIKPSNIILNQSPAGSVCSIVDWGNARFDNIKSTPFGTAGFYAPEQARGEYYPETDIFGLGITLKVLLCGENPPNSRYWKKTRELCPTASENFARMIDRCCDFDIYLRPSSMKEVKEELLSIKQQYTKGAVH